MLPIVAISTSPNTVVIQPPPALTNSSTVSFTVTSPNEVPGLLSGFTTYATHVDVSGATDASSAFFPAASGSVTATLPLTGLTTGSYSVVVQAVDVLGNAGIGVRNASFVVDLLPPTSHFTAPLPSYTATTTLTVSVDAADSVSSVQAYLRHSGAGSPSGEWQSLPPVPCTVTFDALSDGEHLFEVRAVDGAGNHQSPPYDAVATTVDTVPPVPTVFVADIGNGSHVPATSRYSNVATQRVCVTVADASPVTVNLTVTDGDSTVAVLRSAPTVSSGDAVWWVCSAVNVSRQGNHSVIATVLNAAANAAVADATTWFVFDDTPPSHGFQQVPVLYCLPSYMLRAHLTFERQTSWRVVVVVLFAVVCFCCCCGCCYGCGCCCCKPGEHHRLCKPQ